MSRTGRSEIRETECETDNAIPISGNVSGRVEARSM